MAKNETKRLRPTILQADMNALTILQSFADYAPSNPAYAKTAVSDKRDKVKAAQEAELNIQNALATARDTTVAAEWEFHNALLGVKDQVVAQYGDDSNQLQALGLKKKSERKPPTRKAKPD